MPTEKNKKWVLKKKSDDVNNLFLGIYKKLKIKIFC